MSSLENLKSFLPMTDAHGHVLQYLHVDIAALTSAMRMTRITFLPSVTTDASDFASGFHTLVAESVSNVPTDVAIVYVLF
ncbi:unnamed protein product [Rhizoctonia solani]|uniref:Uncharacterized protein n=1 Tax=Rhizoctonia solani TaxID=456999 RepID=A0A8H3DLR5_9AGAM|nr:unnamed protein product [Rhizoctonia solani]